jgi:hypothetical protein
MNQRWHDRRHAFRPDEPINPARYEVIEIEGDATARRFSELCRRGRMVGEVRIELTTWRF